MTSPGFHAFVALYNPAFNRWLSAGRGGDANVDAGELKDFEVFELWLVSFDANKKAAPHSAQEPRARKVDGGGRGTGQLNSTPLSDSPLSQRSHLTQSAQAC